MSLSDDDGLIDLTSDGDSAHATASAHEESIALAASMSDAIGTSSPSAHLLMQQRLFAEFEQAKQKSSAAAATADRTSSNFIPSAPQSSIFSSARVKREVPSTNGSSSLSSFFRSASSTASRSAAAPAPAPSAASSTSADGTAAAGPFRVGVRKRQAGNSDASSAATHSTAAAAASFATTAAAASSAATAAPAANQKFSQASSQSWNSWQPSSQSPSSTPPFAPQRANVKSEPDHPRTASMQTTLKRESKPALHAAAAAPAASSASAAYTPNANEVLMSRRRVLDAELAELAKEQDAIEARRRAIKNEMRSIDEELDKPMQLPYTAPSPRAPLGGVSALLAGPSFWSGSFPWDDAALQTLRSVFKINSFRISQREVINATMDRKDTFVIMPTGAGKSLLYQLPALLNEGVTLVISPLLSLMEDQILNLRNVGIEAYMLCGTTDKEETKHIQAQMLDRHSRMRLLYVTPEKIAKSKQFLSKLEKMHEMGKLVRIVIDEVHCCTHWGHDFRPDYAKLNILKIQFRDVPILAVTATATQKVVADCQKILSIQGCQFFKCSFNRPNLHFAVRAKATSNQAIAKDMYDYIASIGHLRSTGIIYCYSKKETSELSGLLSALGISCDYYHSDVSPAARQRLHHRWVQGQIRVVVATNAFGLGINKADVRFVLHHTFPASCSSYYQEAGRAGRDGHRAYCCLWYSPRDLARQSIRVYAKQDMASHLYPMVAYCHTVDECRRVIMARQFGEVIHPSQCQNMCDVCDLLRPAANGSSQAAAAAAATPTPSVISRDFTEAALQICHLVVAANSAKEVDSGKAKGKRKRSSANVGTVTQKQLLDECKKRSSAPSALSSLSRAECDRLIVELLLQGILRETFKNTAYSTISYIQHDATLLAALKRGDLVVKLTCLQGAATHNHVEEEDDVDTPASSSRKKKPRASRAPPASRARLRLTAPTYDSVDPLDTTPLTGPHLASRTSAFATAVDVEEDEEDFLDEEPSSEVDIDFEEEHDEEERLSQSSEDTPIAIARHAQPTQQHQRNGAGPPSRAAAAASASAAATRYQPHFFSSYASTDAYLDAADADEAAYQAMRQEEEDHGL